MGKLGRFDIQVFPSQALGQAPAAPAAPTYSGVFLAGETVRGLVNVVVNEPITMREMRVNYNGRAYVHWSERRTTGTGDNRRTHTVHYTAHMDYFHDTHVVYHRGNAQTFDGDNVVLNPGTYTFDFAYTIPQNCPSSFEGTVGHIRYYISCTIDRPWRFDKKTKMPFTLLSSLDLNLMGPQIKAPVSLGDDKTVCCLCCASGPISLVATIPRTGYVSGERILISAEVNNRSNRVITKTSAKLYQVTKYYAQGRSRHSKHLVCELIGEGCPAGGVINWPQVPLQIPPVPGSFNVNIIINEYFLFVKADVANTPFNCEVQIPVTIGTVPLREALPSAPVLPPPGAAPAGPYPDMPPPSYNESVFGAVNTGEEDDAHTQGNLSYTPMYPYYGGLFDPQPQQQPPAGGGGQPPPPTYTPQPPPIGFTYNVGNNTDLAEKN